MSHLFPAPINTSIVQTDSTSLSQSWVGWFSLVKPEFDEVNADIATNTSDISTLQTDITNRPIPEYLKYSYTVSSGANGGTATTSTWTKLPLNTEDLDDGNNGSITSNAITLAAGTYLVRASAPFYRTNKSKIRLRNTSDNSTTVVGSSVVASSSAPSHVTSQLEGKFTIAASKTFEFQYYVAVSTATTDLGVATSSGESEVYSQIFFTKIA